MQNTNGMIVIWFPGLCYACFYPEDKDEVCGQNLYIKNKGTAVTVIL